MNLKNHKSENIEKKYISLIEQIKSLISDEADPVAILSNVSAAIQQTFGWLWVGFYLVKEQRTYSRTFPRTCSLF